MMRKRRAAAEAFLAVVKSVSSRLSQLGIALSFPICPLTVKATFKAI
jgi:hypothetical protein